MISLIKQRLLIIAPHPDDEIIGCGGLIQKIKEGGGKVYILFLTVGDTKDFSKKGISNSSTRKKEIEKVAKFLKYDNYDIALEDKQFHLKLDILGQKKLMDVIERESSVSIEEIRPTILALPFSSSYNQDHRLSYEEPADLWNISAPNSLSIFVTFTRKELDIKIKAMKLYTSQNRPFPNLRSLKTLELVASLRGSQIGSAYAEGFGIHRLVL